MVCYLVRHGQDDETVRGGWSNHPLSETGIQQAEQLAEKMNELAVGKIYSSDLCRAMQTAQILADWLHFPVVPLPQFREVNNGDLAGMNNNLALERYPGLFWNQLGWEENYPNGESPKQFYERIRTAWEAFSQRMLSENENVVLVTHSGVIHVILSLLNGSPYTNKEKQRKIPYASMVSLAYENGAWKECM